MSAAIGDLPVSLSAAREGRYNAVRGTFERFLWVGGSSVGERATRGRLSPRFGEGLEFNIVSSFNFTP
jgi:hypothetical protein